MEVYDILAYVLIGFGLGCVGINVTDNLIKFLIYNSILLVIYTFIVKPLLGLS